MRDIILRRKVLRKILEQDKPSDLIALYTFYYYIARHQQTKTPKISTPLTSKLLRWPEERVRKKKKELSKLGLINPFVKRNKKGKIAGHFIEVKFMKRRGVSSTTPMKNLPQGKARGVGSSIYNTTTSLSKGSRKIKNKKTFIPPTLKQVKEYNLEKNLGLIPEVFHEFYESNKDEDGNWVDTNGKIVKSWKRKMLTWYSHQPKDERNQIGQPNKRHKVDIGLQTGRGYA